MGEGTARGAMAATLDTLFGTDSQLFVQRKRECR